jgi:hypothetical protein
VYCEPEKKYRFFGPREAPKLIALLQRANEVISFNGNGFDWFVLRRHYKLKGKLPKKGKHTDLYQVLSAMAGYRVSLDKAAQANFNERKRVNGRAMAELDLSQLRIRVQIGCASDVQTLEST